MPSGSNGRHWPSGCASRLARIHITAALQRLAGERRVKLAVAARMAEALASHLRSTPGVERVEIAGSCRRMRETVGDLDIVVVAQDHAMVMEKLARHDHVQEVVASGTTRATVILPDGRVVFPAPRE